MNIIISIIKSKLTFFKMQVKGRLLHAFELCKPGLGKAPKTFNAINMRFIVNKFINTMINTKMLLIPNINKTVISSPPIRMYNSSKIYLAAYNPLQCGFRAIRNYLCINFPIPFEYTKYDGFTIRSTATFPFYSLCSKVRFINFYFSRERRFKFTKFRNSFTLIEKMNYLI